jgi:hypothetical protein
MKRYLLATAIIAAGLTWADKTAARPPTPEKTAIALTPNAVNPPAAGQEELKMARFYRRKLTYLGKDRPDDVVLCGRWTRYYAQKAGIEKHMATLMCMWHIESQFSNEAGDDGKSFGRAQTRYGYQPELRAWWAARGEILPKDDNDIRTQMAYGVSEFVMKHKAAKGDLWDTVRRYNGCGNGAIAYTHKVFNIRDRLYGLGSPKEKPAPCPTHAHRKKAGKT